jgi:hypothetical protein
MVHVHRIVIVSLVLERRLGTWDSQTTIKPGVWVPDGLKTKGVETIEWVAGRRLIQGKHKHENKRESTFLETYDIDGKVFRSWYFDSEGAFPRAEVTGQWDEEGKTGTYKSLDANQVASTLTIRFVTADQIDWHGLWRDGKGKTLMEIEGKLTRRK